MMHHNTSIFVQFFFELYERFPKHFILLLLLVIFRAILTSISIFAIAPIMDFLVGNNSEEVSIITTYASTVISIVGGGDLQLWHTLVFYGIISLIVGAAGFAVLYASSSIKFNLLHSMTLNMMSSFFKARLTFFIQRHMGTLLNSFQQEMSKVASAFSTMVMLLADVCNAIVFFALPWIISVKITVIFIVITFFLSIPLWLLHRTTYKIGKESTETSNYSTGILHESLTAAKLIFGFGKQEDTVDNYSHAFAQHTDVGARLQTVTGGVMELFPPMATIAALVSCYFAYQEGISFAEISMILISLMRLSPLVGRIFQGKAVIMGFIPAYQQIQILSHEADSLLEPLGDLQFKKLNSEIEFRDVFFSYPDQTLAINAVSMRIKAGKMTALVGKSGSGKTTITDLILGFYLHNSGEILLDGIGVASYDKNSFRNKVGYVPQEAQLFNLSIRENLLWSFPNASENDIWKACRIANAEEFISKLPEQLDTQLGDHGVRLSGGQKQRLALARAVIRKPELLILDEATSALDSESERLIKESLDKLVGKMTILIIAHRLSTIRKSNYVYVLDNGRVVEEGSYDKLSVLSHGQLYNMIREQAF